MRLLFIVLFHSMYQVHFDVIHFFLFLKPLKLWMNEQNYGNVRHTRFAHYYCVIFSVGLFSCYFLFLFFVVVVASCRCCRFLSFWFSVIVAVAILSICFPLNNYNKELPEIFPRDHKNKCICLRCKLVQVVAVLSTLLNNEKLPFFMALCLSDDLDERMDYLSLILNSHKNANAIAIHGTPPTQEYSLDHEWNGKLKRTDKIKQQPSEMLTIMCNKFDSFVSILSHILSVFNESHCAFSIQWIPLAKKLLSWDQSVDILLKIKWEYSIF